MTEMQRCFNPRNTEQTIDREIRIIPIIYKSCKDCQHFRTISRLKKTSQWQYRYTLPKEYHIRKCVLKEIPLDEDDLNTPHVCSHFEGR